MQYIHVALALHSAGIKISAENINKMLNAVGAKPDDGQVKALIAVLDGVDIDEAVKSAPIGMVASTPSSGSAASAASAPKEEPKEEEKEEAGEDMGLDSLFG